MSRSEWVSRFEQWSLGPGKTEADRCENAQRMITQSLESAGVLKKYDAEVFVQGSFANRTHIPQESDVDVCIRAKCVFIGKYPNGLTHEDFGNSSSDLRYADYKNDVERALRGRFGSDVKRGDKCFSLRENSYRVDADVVAAWEYRRYDSAKSRDYFSGTWFRADSGKEIVNWPKQHIANGVQKHDQTNHQFKKIVRVLKRLQFELIDQKVITEKVLPSYAIECCVFNLSNASLSSRLDRYDQIRAAIANVYNATRDEPECKDWVEVNHLKWLFRGDQGWTRQQVNKLVLDAWRHVGFE